MTARKTVLGAIHGLYYSMIMLAIPVLLTLFINTHARIALIETWAHWYNKIFGGGTIFCGDSITASGGHWAFYLNKVPLTTLTIAENGYTISQIEEEVKVANTYHPKYICMLGGTNDAFKIATGRETIDQAVTDFTDMLNMAHSKKVITLPFPTRDPSVNDILSQLRMRFKSIAVKYPDAVCVDVTNDLAQSGLLAQKFTVDGTHLSEAGKKIWAKRLQEALSAH